MKTIPVAKVLTNFGVDAPSEEKKKRQKEKPPEETAQPGKPVFPRVKAPFPTQSDKHRIPAASSRSDRHHASTPPPKKKAPIEAIPTIEDDSIEEAEQEKGISLSEVEKKLEKQRLFYEQKLEVERCTWVSREAEVFREQFMEGQRSIQNDLAKHIARILKPFLTQQIHQKAMSSLWEALDVLFSREQCVTLEISGPEDFLQLLREKLSETNVTAEFSSNEKAEVRVRAGQTTIETQLGAWLDKLKEFTG
jgi:hypothetical protein